MPKVKIDNVEYEIPQLPDFTLDEGIMFERMSGHTVGQVEQMEEIPLGAVKAIMVVAILRAKPNVTVREAEKVVGKLPLVGVDEMFVADEEFAPDPTSTQQPESEPSASPEPSGPTSSGVGEASPDSTTPANSGDLASEPSHSDHLTSAA